MQRTKSNLSPASYSELTNCCSLEECVTEDAAFIRSRPVQALDSILPCPFIDEAQIQGLCFDSFYHRNNRLFHKTLPELRGCLINVEHLWDNANIPEPAGLYQRKQFTANERICAKPLTRAMVSFKNSDRPTFFQMFLKGH